MFSPGARRIQTAARQICGLPRAPFPASARRHGKLFSRKTLTSRSGMADLAYQENYYTATAVAFQGARIATSLNVTGQLLPYAGVVTHGRRPQ